MRAEKQFLFDEIESQIESFPNFIISDYAGQGANENADFRTKVAQSGGQVEVVRKRILAKVLEKMGVSLDPKALPGHVSLVYMSEDAAVVAKCLLQAQKEGLKSKVLGGFFEGKLLAADQVKVIATLPTKDEMRAQLLATFVAPMSQTLSVVNALLTSVPHCLENQAAKESSAA